MDPLSCSYELLANPLNMHSQSSILVQGMEYVFKCHRIGSCAEGKIGQLVSSSYLYIKCEATAS